MNTFAGEELFWCRLINSGDTFSLTGDDLGHITKVMRHKIGDYIHVTAGSGIIYKVLINSIDSAYIHVEKINEIVIPNRLNHFIIAIPRLKGTDKIEFLLEKLTEIGFTRFLFFESDYCVGKGYKLDRWEKVIRAASKQSFMPFTPELITVRSFKEIFSSGNRVIGFDLESENQFSPHHIDQDSDQVLVCGPEGGLSRRELEMFNSENLFRLTKNRLRSETAILYSSILVSSFN